MKIDTEPLMKFIQRLFNFMTEPHILPQNIDFIHWIGAKEGKAATKFIYLFLYISL